MKSPSHQSSSSPRSTTTTAAESSCSSSRSSSSSRKNGSTCNIRFLRSLGFLVALIGIVRLVLSPMQDYVLTTTTTITNHQQQQNVRRTAAATTHEEEEEDETTNMQQQTSSLLLQMAPTIFPMDPKDPTKIKFPSQVDTVTIDIGARESDYLKAMEFHNTNNNNKTTTTTTTFNNNMALILIDPLPGSVLPLISRAANYNLRGSSWGTYPHPNTGDRIFVVRGAMGDKEAVAQNFHMGLGPSCGSLLETSPNNSFWCWDTKQELPTNVFTLQSLLDMIPQPQQIRTIHIKIDAEGADHLVLKGGGKALERVSTIIIECREGQQQEQQDHNGTATTGGGGGVGVGASREGQCNNNHVIEWMCEKHNFCGYKVVGEYDSSNIMFWNPQKLLSSASSDMVIIPDIFLEEPIAFHYLYKELKMMSQIQQQQQQK